MREIKFRAWDKKERLWVGGFCISAGGAFSYFWELGKPQPTWVDADEQERRFVIQQYTGLKDKNGKEIYEGDIIVWKPNNHKPMELGHVEYRQNAFVTIRNGQVETMMFDGDDEVVGNIYENPDLLERRPKVDQEQG